MSRLTRLLRGHRVAGMLSGRPENLWKDLIAREAPGTSFLDVGCMWRVNGAYAFHALSRGATDVVGLDVLPATLEFEAENATSGNRVRFVQGDVNDPALGERLGSFEVVFCSGVLYHAPNPLHTLAQLRRLCRRTLILTTASTAERGISNAAVFLPFIDSRSRRRLGFWTPNIKRALDGEFDPTKDYGNWFWLPTPSCVRAMITVAGFEVRESHVFRHVTTVVARVAGG